MATNCLYILSPSIAGAILNPLLPMKSCGTFSHAKPAALPRLSHAQCAGSKACWLKQHSAVGAGVGMWQPFWSLMST